MARLTAGEKALRDSFDREEWVQVPDNEVGRQRLRSYAEGTFKKDQRINIRISSNDLLALKKRAVEEGLPYQSLIASVLHKYLTGRLREREGV